MSEADSKTMAKQIQSKIPAGRFGDVSEVANTIVFLASDEAFYIVGSELIIDGGMSNLKGLSIKRPGVRAGLESLNHRCHFGWRPNSRFHLWQIENTSLQN
jgi:hypothetical protein